MSAPPNRITQIFISGLHGQHNVTIPITDERSILVGVNGLGKTTIANIAYYFMTQQWAHLLRYDFTEVGIEIGGHFVRLTKKSLEHAFERVAKRALPASLARRIRMELVHRQTSGEDTGSAQWLRRTSRELDIPIAYLRQLMFSDIDEERQEFKGLGDLEKQLKSLVDAQVIYLPTYRRIEKDLRFLFPGMDRQFDEALEQRKRERTSQAHLELVEFGMRDVEQRLAEAFEEIKDTARRELNKLAGSYLREVIRDEAREFDAEMIRNLDDGTISAILDRIREPALLQPEDKVRLRESIQRLRSSSDPDEHPKYVAHFFGKLNEIHQTLKAKEDAVSRLVFLCNRYLQDSEKSLVFDSANYAVHCELSSGRRLPLGDLSSGEKQIVSLFTHLLLSRKQLYVIIDEPELSLSVEWQRRLLPDIADSGRCKFLFAVTHSPFVFDNGLDPYAKDLRRLLSSSTGGRSK